MQARRVALFAVLFAALLGSTSSEALEVRLQGGLLSLKADGVPLREILKELVHAGVAVKIDPRIETTPVTGICNKADVEVALDALLEPFGYALLWDVIEGPVGPMPKLAEIQIFQPGEKEKIEPFLVEDDNYRVATGPIAGGPQFVADEILLSVKPGTSLDAFRRFLFEIGGTVVASIPEMGIYRIRVPAGTNIPALIEQLKHNPIVSTTEPNYIVEAPTPGMPGGSGPTRPAVNLPRPADGVAPIAILDSGLMDVEALDQVVVGRYDSINPERALTDSVGHGTQMALVAAGAITPDGAAAGEGASGVPIVAIRAFDDNGRASNFGLLRSIEYALGQGSRVMNLSWGTQTHSDFLSKAVSYAQSRGMVLVAAAGNEPTGRPFYPAAYRGVLAVSATDADGGIWKSSNYGDFVSFAAPGAASFPVGHKGPPGSYAGTSISSAYAARAIAQYLAEHPTADRRQVFDALHAALTDAGEEGRDPRFGYGVLDAAALRRFLGN